MALTGHWICMWHSSCCWGIIPFRCFQRAWELWDGYFSTDTWTFHRKHFHSRTECFPDTILCFGICIVWRMLIWCYTVVTAEAFNSHLIAAPEHTFLGGKILCSSLSHMADVTACVRLWIAACLCYLNCPRRRQLNMTGDMSLCHRKT